jgi:aryl-alcohol dehydrogenase-like predicted oxidoreductase
MHKSIVLSRATSNEYLESNLKVNRITLAKKELRALKK